MDNSMLNKQFKTLQYHHAPNMDAMRFFGSKVAIVNCDPFELERDVLVSFCHPEITKGGEEFERLSALAGPDLPHACSRYKSLAVGSCRITSAFRLTNYKGIVHAVVLSMTVDESTPVSRYQLALCYRNCLDVVSEDCFRTIVFPVPACIPTEAGAETALMTIRLWIERSPYASTFGEVTFCCSDRAAYDTYVSTAETMESGRQSIQEMEPELAYEEDASFQLSQEGSASGEVMVEQDHGDFYVWDQDNAASISYATDDGPVEYTSYSDADNGGIVAPDEHVPEEAPRGLLADVSSSEDRGEVVYNEMYGSPSGIRLHLSRNLSSTILTVEQPDGFLRQYRMTTHSKEGDALYFRCSRCESLLKNGYGDYRPKITVRDGVIQGNRFPPHHPDCHPITKQSVVIQQMDRQARVRICNDGMEPRDAYDNMKDYVEEDMHADGGQFPEWNKVRKQYYRIRRLAGERSSQTDPQESSTVTSRVEERVLECDDELERQNNSATWKEEIVEQSGDPDEAVYYDDVPATLSMSRHQLESEVVHVGGGFVEYVEEQEATTVMEPSNSELPVIQTVSINARLARMEKVVPQSQQSPRQPSRSTAVWRQSLSGSRLIPYSDDNWFSLTSEAAAAARKCRIIRVRKRAIDDVEFSAIRQCSPDKQQSSSSNATEATSNRATDDRSL